MMVLMMVMLITATQNYYTMLLCVCKKSRKHCEEMFQSPHLSTGGLPINHTLNIMCFPRLENGSIKIIKSESF